MLRLSQCFEILISFAFNIFARSILSRQTALCVPPRCGDGATDAVSLQCGPFCVCQTFSWKITQTGTRFCWWNMFPNWFMYSGILCLSVFYLKLIASFRSYAFVLLETRLATWLNKKLSCRRDHATWRFVSLNILLSYSKWYCWVGVCPY